MLPCWHATYSTFNPTCCPAGTQMIHSCHHKLKSEAGQHCFSKLCTRACRQHARTGAKPGEATMQPRCHFARMMQACMWQCRLHSQHSCLLCLMGLKEQQSPLALPFQPGWIVSNDWHPGWNGRSQHWKLVMQSHGTLQAMQRCWWARRSQQWTLVLTFHSNSACSVPLELHDQCSLLASSCPSLRTGCGKAHPQEPMPLHGVGPWSQQNL